LVASFIYQLDSIEAEQNRNKQLPQLVTGSTNLLREGR